MGLFFLNEGMSAWNCPGTFMILSYLEHGFGLFHATGGLNHLCTEMADVTIENGGTIKTGTGVKKIIVNGRGTIESRSCNGDALTIYQQLLDEANRPSMTNRKLASYELSKQYPHLEHHNVFFSENY